jgi:hypothetical protein
VDASPCTVCARGEAEDCVKFVQEYCSEHPEDSGCAFFRPVFVRTIAEKAMLAVHVPAAVLASSGVVEVPPADCGCGGACGSNSPVAVVDSQFHSALRVLALTLDIAEVGEFLVCVGGVSVTELVVIAEPGCAFEAGVGTPCVAPSCIEAPESEACQLVLAEYCTKHGYDEACAFLVPRFARPAMEQTTLQFHAPVVAGPSPYAVNKLCNVDSFTSEAELRASPCVTEVDFLQTARQDGTMVVLELLPYVIGQYEIHFPTSETSAGNGSRAATVVVAHQCDGSRGDVRVPVWEVQPLQRCCVQDTGADRRMHAVCRRVLLRVPAGHRLLSSFALVRPPRRRRNYDLSPRGRQCWRICHGPAECLCLRRGLLLGSAYTVCAEKWFGTHCQPLPRCGWRLPHLLRPGRIGGARSPAISVRLRRRTRLALHKHGLRYRPRR